MSQMIIGVFPRWLIVPCKISGWAFSAEVIDKLLSCLFSTTKSKSINMETTGCQVEEFPTQLSVYDSSYSFCSQIAAMTRTLSPPTALEIPGLRWTATATFSSACAQETAEGSGSVNDTPHFTPLAWVRTPDVPVSFHLPPVWAT